MNIIEQLKKYEKNQLDEWILTDLELQEKFIEEVGAFADENPSEIKDYCLKAPIAEDTTLAIVYEALTEHSKSKVWDEFCLEELKRIINLAKGKKIDTACIRILFAINTEEIHANNREVYTKMLEFINTNLQLKHEDQFNVELLDLFEVSVIDEDANSVELKKWIGTVTRLANEGNLPVKVKARKVLKELEVNATLTPLSFMEKLKGVFMK